MRKYAVLILIVMGLGSLCAELAWPQPVEVCAFDNVNFAGISLLTTDGCQLLSWMDTSDGIQKQVFRLLDQNNLPIWTHPFPWLIGGVKTSAVETADSCFVLISSSYPLAHKISRSGELMWGPDGITFSASSPQRFSMAADLYGGVFIAWNGTSVATSPAAIQHLDSSGNITMPEGGLMLDNGQSAKSTDLRVLPDNSVLVSWTGPYQVRVNRLDSLGQSLWNQPISINTTYWNPRASLCEFGDQAFGIMYDHNDGLDLERYNISGTPLWASPVTVISDSEIDPYTPNAKLAPDGSIFVAANSWSGLKLQRVSPEGALLFPELVHLNAWLGYINSFSDILVDDLGNCIAVVSSSDTPTGVYNINAVKISPWGIVSIHPVTNTSARNERPKAHRSGSNTRVVWQRWDADQCGIILQVLDSGMQNTLAENGTALVVGSSGIARDIQTAVTDTGAYVLWHQTTQDNERWRLMLQRYTSSGQPMYGDQGCQINSPGSKVLAPTKILSNGNSLILIWSENVNSATIRRIQIIDENGNLLMGESGMEFGPTSYGLSVSYYMGEWYVVWYVGASLMGQKISGTQAMWGIGLQLTEPDPQNPGNILSCELKMPWLMWSVNSQRYCKRIDGSGATLPGFQPWGMVVPNPFDQIMNQDLTYTAIENYLHVFRRNYGASTTSMHTLIGPNGEIIFGPTSLSVYGPYKIFAHNGEIWITSHTTDYKVQKYDIMGAMLLDQSIAIPHPNYWDSHWHHILPTGEHLLLIHLDSMGWDLRHLYLSESLIPQTPADDLIYSQYSYMIVPTSVSMQDARCWVAWGCGEDFTHQYQVGIRLQKIVRAGVALPDTEAQAPAKPLLTGCSPNPFNPSASITFHLPQAGKARLAVYDLKGRKLRELMNCDLSAGEHSTIWDGKYSDGQKAASGVYILRLESGANNHTRRITLMK